MSKSDKADGTEAVKDQVQVPKDSVKKTFCERLAEIFSSCCKKVEKDITDKAVKDVQNVIQQKVGGELGQDLAQISSDVLRTTASVVTDTIITVAKDEATNLSGETSHVDVNLTVQ